MFIKDIILSVLSAIFSISINLFFINNKEKPHLDKDDLLKRDGFITRVVEHLNNPEELESKSSHEALVI